MEVEKFNLKNGVLKYDGKLIVDGTIAIGTLKFAPIVDVSRQPYPEPCPDCHRIHLNGEHIALNVPTTDGTRVAWEGCVDCWVARTGPFEQPILPIDRLNLF